MKELIENIYDAIYASLHDLKYSKEIKDQRSFTKAIIENGLCGLVFESLDLSVIDAYYQKLLRQTYYHYISRDLSQQITLLKLKALLNKEAINYILLKGSHIKNEYPKTYMRGMTDIDLLVEEHAYKKANKILKINGYQLTSRYYYHNTYLSKEKEHIELHPFIQHDFDQDYDAMFLDPFKHVKIENSYEKTFNPEYELNYLLYHLVKHIENGGIGLRSILDIYLFTKHHELNDAYLNVLLKKTKLKSFYELIISLHNYYLHDDIKMEHFDFDQYHANDYEKIIKVMLKTGVHGKGTSNDAYQNIIINRSIHSLSDKLKYLIKSMFPSYKMISSRFKIIKYIPILLPFYWIYRWFKLAFVKTSVSMHKLKELINHKKSEENHLTDFHIKDE